MMKHADEKDHLVSEALTEGSEAGALLLLLGKMLFLTYSAKGNPLGGLYILPKDSQNICDELKSTMVCHVSTMRFIFNTGLASQFMMGTIQTGQSVQDGYNTVWPVSSRWIQYSLASWSKMVQQIDRPVGLGPVTSRFGWLV